MAPVGREREADALRWIVHRELRRLVAIGCCQLLVAGNANHHASAQQRRLIYDCVLERRQICFRHWHQRGW